MARGINQVILMGRLTRDPDMRTTASGKNVTSFSLAVDRQGQDDQAAFFAVTAWEKTGELVNQYLSKGRRCLVQGRLRQDSWEDKDTGKKRSRVEVVAFDVTFLDGPNDGAGGGQSRPSAPAQAASTPAPSAIDDAPIDLSEIPF